MANKSKKARWEREDKFLDYVAGHKNVILRYLYVVLIGEVLRWALGIICSSIPALFPFQNAITFLCWGLPYFVVCKLWVWEQKGDTYFVWATQSMKFLMTILAVALLLIPVQILLQPLPLPAGVTKLLINIIWEVLYFIAMFKFVLKVKK